MTDKQQTIQEWGNSIVMTGEEKDFEIVCKPKWWQFWKKPRTIRLEDVINTTKAKMAQNILDKSFK